MPNDWKFQLRVYLTDAGAAAARRDADSPALGALGGILRAHRATLKCQFDAFADYVAEAEAKGVDQFPLYRWTKATIEDADKAAKHRKAFAVRVDGDEVYAKDVADALEADLQTLAGGALVTRLSRHDTNPANNLPVPENFRS